jgi:hypothetical protein
MGYHIIDRKLLRPRKFPPVGREKRTPGLFLRSIFMLLILVALAPGAAAAGLFSKIGIALNPETLFSLNGNYSGSLKLKEMLLPGAGLGLTLRYRLHKNVLIDGSFSYNWMFLRENKRPADYVSAKPAFVAPMYTLNGAFYPLSGRVIEPYLTIGGGICPWWFSSRPTGGVLWSAPADANESFTKVSPFIDGGLGVEVRLSSRLSILGEAKYYHVFAKDRAKFGADGFGDQNLLGISLGAAFYFGGRNSKKSVEDYTP